MFYLLHGEDTFRSKEKLKELIVFFREKISDLGIFKVEGENFDWERMQEFLKGQTLFEKKYVVVCEGVLANKEASSLIEKGIEKFAVSQNVFLFWEEVLPEELVEKLEPHAEKTQRFDFLTGAKLKKWFDEKNISAMAQEEIINRCGSDLWCAMKEIERGETERGLDGKQELFGDQKEKGGFNVFNLCDAVAARDRKRSWVLFNEAMLAGIEAEEIFYKILWQVKNLMIVKKLLMSGEKNLSVESGMKPYPLQKALSAVSKFSEEELSKFSFALVKLFHDSRWGVEDLAIGVERFLIGI